MTRRTPAFRRTRTLLAGDDGMRREARKVLGSSRLGRTVRGAGWLVLSREKKVLVRWNRKARQQQQKVLFGWPTGRNGFSLLWADYSKRSCPCFECFEVSNPKAFSKGSTPVHRRLILRAVHSWSGYLRSGRAPFGRLILSSGTGPAFEHEVPSSPKCPARLTDEGFRITP